MTVLTVSPQNGVISNTSNQDMTKYLFLEKKKHKFITCNSKTKENSNRLESISLRESPEIYLTA